LSHIGFDVEKWLSQCDAPLLQLRGANEKQTQEIAE
jgi:hypothetical protein